MRKTKFRISDPNEAAFLAHMVVREVWPQELARCQQEVCEHHYLKNAHLVGEQLWYVAETQGQWLALLGWSAAAYHLKGRDTWIGWDDTRRRARLSLVANNARFCLLPPCEQASQSGQPCLGPVSPALVAGLAGGLRPLDSSFRSLAPATTGFCKSLKIV